jgi:hypothetical protein
MDFIKNISFWLKRAGFSNSGYFDIAGLKDDQSKKLIFAALKYHIL